ncbi:MAG: hypothetical protein AAFV88_25930, partial [Planctomycetota bacterium]
MADENTHTIRLIKSLAGTSCDGCDGTKPARRSFCRRCFYSLPKALQRRLYQRIGQGYESAYAEALD